MASLGHNELSASQYWINLDIFNSMPKIFSETQSRSSIQISMHMEYIDVKFIDILYFHVSIYHIYFES